MGGGAQADTTAGTPRSGRIAATTIRPLGLARIKPVALSHSFINLPATS